MKYKSFLYEQRDNGVAIVTLNRPERLNALTFEMYRELGNLGWDLREDDSVSVLIITGAGRGFCPGGDMHEIMEPNIGADSDRLLAFQRMAGRVTTGLLSMRKPAIAAINGFAAGAGAVIALACDIRIAVPSAKFAFLFPKVGLPSTDIGSCWLLPRVIGLGRASPLLLTGDTIDAQEAERIGLINQIVPEDKLMQVCIELADRLAKNARLSTGMTKNLMYRELTMDFDTAIDYESWIMSLALHTADGQEGAKAIVQKRPPVFKGK